MARYRTGLIYMTDRWGLGLYIMEYTGGYALPPLGLLVALSEGKFETGMAEVLKMTDKLETELPTMLAEHQDIVVALRKLIEAARTEHKPDIVHFAEKLMLHAQTEEQVSYPTALLIGRYVKSKLAA